MIEYRKLSPGEVTPALFDGFERRQEVTRCWRHVDGKWVLRDNPFIDDWTADEYVKVAAHLNQTMAGGGTVTGAFEGPRLVGFGSVEACFFGSRGQYLQLSELHVTSVMRGRGIGRELFRLLAQAAKAAGAERLYISGHSAEETQAFYKRMGCTEALEINKALQTLEPYDCQLELALCDIIDEVPLQGTHTIQE